MKKTLLTLLTILVATACLSSCNSFSNMSEQEAYDNGYAIGSAIRQVLDSRK